jgi:hypothetical protein
MCFRQFNNQRIFLMLNIIKLFKGNLMTMSQFNKFLKGHVIGHLKVNLLNQIHGKGLRSIHSKGVKDLTQEFNPNKVNPL